MTAYLLDTNHLSPLVTLDHPLRARVLARLRAGDTFAIPVPALTEMLFGISMLRRAAQNRAEWARLADKFSYINISRVDAEKAAQLQVRLRRRGWQLATVDALIATIALRYQLVLLTTDRDFTAVPHLRWANWWVEL